MSTTLWKNCSKLSNDKLYLAPNFAEDSQVFTLSDEAPYDDQSKPIVDFLKSYLHLEIPEPGDEFLNAAEIDNAAHQD